MSTITNKFAKEIDSFFTWVTVTGYSLKHDDNIIQWNNDLLVNFTEPGRNKLSHFLTHVTQSYKLYDNNNTPLDHVFNKIIVKLFGQRDKTTTTPVIDNDSLQNERRQPTDSHPLRFVLQKNDIQFYATDCGQDVVIDLNNADIAQFITFIKQNEKNIIKTFTPKTTKKTSPTKITTSETTKKRTKKTETPKKRGKKLAETPIETPVETPIETPIETPVETLIETPVETLIETPVETPIETPIETPVETPIETPVETSAETSAETPVDTPKKRVKKIADNNTGVETPKKRTRKISTPLEQTSQFTDDTPVKTFSEINNICTSPEADIDFDGIDFSIPLDNIIKKK